MSRGIVQDFALRRVASGLQARRGLTTAKPRGPDETGGMQRSECEFLNMWAAREVLADNGCYRRVWLGRLWVDIRYPHGWEEKSGIAPDGSID